MQGYNLIVVFNKSLDKVLLCKRKKQPYLGLYNFVGGKIEKGENSQKAAYRELFEETGIKKEQILLTHFCDFHYYFDDCYVEVYSGKLNEDVSLIDETNPLCWGDANDNFFNMEKYAGEGNMGHILEEIFLAKDFALK